MTETRTNTEPLDRHRAAHGSTPEPRPAQLPSTMRRWMYAGALLSSIAVALIMAMTLFEADDHAEIADIGGQGGEGAALAPDGARLVRRSDGLLAQLDVPLPEPGSYVYPTADMVPPWAGPQPPVSPGARDAPEIFTVWLAVFNDGSLCTDGQCDSDDLGADAPAGGGMYQLDGRIADDEQLRFVGNIRLGQEPLVGVPLAAPQLAEVHILIAPHGRALNGADGWRQLNGPVGNPSLWWAAQFPGL